MKFSTAALFSLAIFAAGAPAVAQTRAAPDTIPAESADRAVAGPDQRPAGLLLPAIQRVRGGVNSNAQAGGVFVASGDVDGDGRPNAAPSTSTNLVPAKSICPTCTVTGLDDDE